MNFVKKNYKLIVGIIIGAILISGISVYATGQYLASQVEYNKNGQAKVSDALDDLYSKVPSGTKTITTKGSNIDVSKYQYADTTGLYTLSEMQSGKGAHWNSGSETCTANSDISINLGFVPSSIIVLNTNEDGGKILYNSIYGNKSFTCSPTGIQKYDIGTSYSTGTYIKSIGTTVTFHSANANTWYWFATE